MDELARQDYWRAVMYTKIRESLAGEAITGDGVEFGGSNGIIQSMLPGVIWETRRHPPYDIGDGASYERSWDVIVADQVLEHVARPWEAMRLIGEHTRKLAIITVPFLIGIHNSPGDYWRMTPQAISRLAAPHFSGIAIQSWGNAKAAYWHAIYNRTSRLMRNVPEVELDAGLSENDASKPFVIWAILRK